MNQNLTIEEQMDQNWVLVNFNFVLVPLIGEIILYLSREIMPF